MQRLFSGSINESYRNYKFYGISAFDINHVADLMRIMKMQASGELFHLPQIQFAHNIIFYDLFNHVLVIQFSHEKIVCHSKFLGFCIPQNLN